MNSNTRRTGKITILDNIENLKQSILLNKLSIESNYIERCRRNSEYNSENDSEKDLRLMRKRISVRDFKILRPIGAGAFGIIRLAECRQTGNVYALKQMRKSTIRTKNQLERIYNERTLLVKNASDFVVKLFYTFQDEKHLYQVMEYLPGGDLMSYLIKYDKFTEEDTKFYMAQLVHAIDLVHQLGFVHRDVKPDNIVLDSRGHLKLLDFGLCKFSPGIERESTVKVFEMNKKSFVRGTINDVKGMNKLIDEKKEIDCLENSIFNKDLKEECCSSKYPDIDNNKINTLLHLNRKAIHSTVGTPQYMAPEIFLRQGYTHLVDWWSVGILMYECLYGGVPFNDDTHNPIKVAIKVMQWEKLLLLPHPCRKISPEALDLLKNLLCHHSKRFDGEQIKKHPFFRGKLYFISVYNFDSFLLEIDWDHLRETSAPFSKSVPEDSVQKNNVQINGCGDTLADESPNTLKFGIQGSSLVDLNFLDYTFRNIERGDSMSFSEVIKMCR